MSSVSGENEEERVPAVHKDINLQLSSSIPWCMRILNNLHWFPSTGTITMAHVTLRTPLRLGLSPFSPQLLLRRSKNNGGVECDLHQLVLNVVKVIRMIAAGIWLFVVAAVDLLSDMRTNRRENRSKIPPITSAIYIVRYIGLK